MAAEYTADEVREELDRIYEERITHTENVPETIEGFARCVVEQGDFFPDCHVTADVSLTPMERLTGRRKQDVTAMLSIGLILGAALERDIPADSEREAAWRDGAVVLPEGGHE